MRPLLLLVSSGAPGAPSLDPLGLAIAQGGWPVQRLGAGSLWVEPGDEVVVLAHGAAGSALAATQERVQLAGGAVRAIVLVDPSPELLSARPRPAAPVGVLRLRPEQAVPDGWPVRDAPGGPSAPERGARAVAGPLLRLLGDLAVPGGLVTGGPA